MLSALYWREKQKVIGRELGSKLDWESVIVPVFSKFVPLFAYREEKPPFHGGSTVVSFSPWGSVRNKKVCI
jgi:hypothetical protein